MRFISLSLVLIFTFSVGASESGTESAEQKPLAPGEKNPVKEWTDKITQLNALETRIKGLTGDIQFAVKEMDAMPVSEEKVKKTQEISNLHEELKKNVGSFNKLREELKYRFPAQGDFTERRYLPMRIQSIEDISKESGVDYHLTRFRQKIDKKYKVAGEKPKNPEAENSAPTETRAPASTPVQTSEEDKPKRLRLEK